MRTLLQIPSIILPDVSAQDTILGTETETIDDLVEHTSLEFPVEFLQNKTIHITATEVALAAVVAGNLLCWIELSPYPSANSVGVNTYWRWPLPTSVAYWGAIGGGGAALPPVAPLVEASGLGGAAGVLIHGIMLPWAIHSAWARLVVQTPVAAALPNAYWVIQARVSAKTS